MATLKQSLFVLNRRKGIPKRAIKNGQSREIGNIGYTRRRRRKQKHHTICVGHHYVQKHTN